MGAMKEMLMEFCAVVYPDNYDDQDSLFEDMCVKMRFGNYPGTLSEFRESYEVNHIPPPISTEDMLRLMENAEEQSCPALTLRRACQMFGVQYH